MRINLKWTLNPDSKITNDYGGSWQLFCNQQVVGSISVTPTDSLDFGWEASGDSILHLEHESFEFECETVPLCMTAIEDNAKNFFKSCFPKAVITVDRSDLASLHNRTYYSGTTATGK